MTGIAYNEQPTAMLYPATANRKLSPVEMQPNSTKRLRPVPVGPFVASTYVSLGATCPSSCPFRENGCYVTSGFYAPVARTLDENARGREPYSVIEEEALLIEQFARARHYGNRGVPRDGGKDGEQGRDLRLHVGGDVPDERSAERLAKAAVIWRIYGGGRVWTYTHRWREVKRSAWGEISVLASVETLAEASEAEALGYTPALVVQAHASAAAWKAESGTKYIPCPAETGEATCVQCRLCFDSKALAARRSAIVFQAHGLHKHKIKSALNGKKVRRLTVVA